MDVGSELRMLRSNIEYSINSGLDHHRDFDTEDVTLKQPTSSDPVDIADTELPGLGEFGTPFKVVYREEAVTIQIDIHLSNLPVSLSEFEALLETQEQIALSDLSQWLERFESVIIDTVANELGKKYDGEHSQAIKNQTEATFIHPSDNVLKKPADPNVFAFCCQFDPDKFWELD